MNRRTVGLLFLFWFAAVPLYADSQTQTINLTFSIAPVTVVKVSSPGKVVHIGPVIPRVDTSGESLQVSILTNTEDRYQVFHELRSDITSNSGGEFPSNELEFLVSNGKNGGTSGVPSKTPVSRDKVPIFNSPGGPDLFAIQYFVSNKKSFSAGDYYGNVSITIENA